jgi:WD40 repeat protein
MMPTLTCLSLSTSKVISLHFAKQGRVLYTASMDGVICELDTRTGKPKDTFKASKKSINHLTISHGKCSFYFHVLLPYAYLKDLSIKVPCVCFIHGKIFTNIYGLIVKQCYIRRNLILISLNVL